MRLSFDQEDLFLFKYEWNLDQIEEKQGWTCYDMNIKDNAPILSEHSDDNTKDCLID